MISALPATIEDRKKETGITGDHHCRSTMFGMSRKSEPSELWCIVDSVTAAIASMIGSKLCDRARKIQAIAPKTTAGVGGETKFCERQKKKRGGGKAREAAH